MGSRRSFSGAQVAALLRQCGALEAQSRQTRTLGAHLLDALVGKMKEEG